MATSKARQGNPVARSLRSAHLRPRRTRVRTRYTRKVKHKGAS